MRTAYYILFLIIALALAGFIGLIAYYSYTPPPQNQPKTQTNNNAKQLSNESPQLTRPVISSSDPVRGEISAPLALVEFSDFACPACAEVEPTLQKLLLEYQGKIKLVWKDLPNIRLHPLAQKAATAARCAQEQGKFWEYHDRLFESQGQLLSEQGLSLLANNLNLDLNLFTQCLTAGRADALVTQTYNEALLLKVDATPYFFINETRLSGAVSKETLETVIKTALSQL